MMKKLVLVITLIASLSPAASFAAPTLSNADVRDLHCLVLYNDVSNSIAQQTDEQKIGFASIVSYFTGKLYGRHADFDLAAAVTPEIIAAARSLSEAGKKSCQDEALAFGNSMTVTAPLLDK